MILISGSSLVFAVTPPLESVITDSPSDENYFKFGTSNYKSWRTATLLKKVTPSQMPSCETCEIFKNSFIYRTPPVSASKKINPL